MRDYIKRNATRFAVIAASLLIASMCAVSGTLAALSANYSWSDSMKAGSFDYADLSKTFDLFGENDVFPGDHGSAVLETVDLGTNSVSWSFAETNADVMPVVFYTLNEGVPAGIYSKYNFGTYLADYFIGLQNESGMTYVSCSDISNDASSIAAELDFGETLCWTWPSTLYFDASGSVAADSAAAEYDQYSSALCIDTYGITSDTLEALDGSIYSATYPTFYANGYNNGFEALNLGENTLSEENGLLKVGDTFVKTYDGTSFKDITSESILGVNDYYVAFVLASGAENYISALTAAGITNITRFDNNLYKKTSIGDFWAVDAAGNRAAVKIKPSKINEKATINVTVTATVTQA